MPDNIDQLVLGSIPKSSTGIVSTNQKDKNSMNEKGKIKGSDQNTLLSNASKKNRVAVVIDAETSVEQSVYSQQDTRQVYVTQSRRDARGNVYEVLIARYEAGVYAADDPDGSLIIALKWVDVKHITCGSLADAKIVVGGSQPVQTEPEVTVTPEEKDNRMLESFIFFDHFMGGTNAPQEHIYALERAIGLQREVAKFMNLYNGGISITEKQQAKIDKQVHLVPFSDISQDYVDKYPVFKANPSPGINASKDKFYEYWKTHVATSKVHVVILFNHSGHDGLALLEAGAVVIKMWELFNLQIPKIDYILLLGCNLGNLTTLTDGKNFAITMADLTQGSNPVEQTQSFFDNISGKEKTYKTYPTAVVAADGNTYCPVKKKGEFITGISFSVGKYTDHAHIHFDESEGFCVFEKGKGTKAIPIPGTAAVRPQNRSKKVGDDIGWILQEIPIENMLKEAENIIQQR